MPRLGQRKDDNGVPTYLRLPRATRAGLEAAIGREDIKSLTDAVIAAEKALTKQLRQKRTREESK